jgi:uncharacterized protein YceK
MRLYTVIVLLFLAALITLSGCTSFKAVEIVAPEYDTTVSELQPTLQWKAVPGKDVTYDLIIYKDDEINPVYYQEGLTENSHSVKKELKPGTLYRWSVRSRIDGNESEWSKKETRIFTGVSYHQRSVFMRFLTPASP